MRCVVVGCGTVVPEPASGGSSYYIEHDDARILLDCGPGAVQAAARLGVPWETLTHLFITHFHADHVGALPGLFFAFRHGTFPPREAPPLEVWGPAGTQALFRALADGLGDFLIDPGFPMLVREIFPGTGMAIGGLKVAARHVPHTAESLAYRLDSDAAALVYTGDTGPDEDLADFARHADVLIAECSLPDELVGDNHLSPSRLARLAGRAGVNRLIATHVYPQFRESADVAGLISAAGFEGRIELAREGLELHL